MKIPHPIRRWQRWKQWAPLAHSMNKFQKILVLLKLKPCTWFDNFVDWRNVK